MKRPGRSRPFPRTWQGSPTARTHPQPPPWRAGSQRETRMKWFGRKAAREAARPALSRAGNWSALGDWPRSYEAQVREGYCHNPVAQRAVKLVSEAVGSAPLLASDPALLKLAAARSGGQALAETLAAQ